MSAELPITRRVIYFFQENHICHLKNTCMGITTINVGFLPRMNVSKRLKNQIQAGKHHANVAKPNMCKNAENVRASTDKKIK